MKKKFYINSNTERLFSFTASLLLILGLNILLANTLLKKIKDNAVSQFIMNCDDSIQDYTDAVESKLLEIESRLDIFYAKIAYKNLSTETIRKFLIEQRENIRPPFDMVVYADKDGMSWNADGKNYTVTDRDYFQKIISGRTSFYVSGILESKHTGNSVLVFARPVLNDSNVITGVLFATCPIENMAEFFNGIKIAKEKNFAIQDSRKKLIQHYDKKWINWVYSPWKYSDKKLKISDQIFNVKESISTSGEPVYVFYRKIESSSWTISLSIPISEFDKISRAQNSYHNFIIEVIVVALSIILLLEIWVHSVLERHQILSTHIDSLTHLWVRNYFEKEANKLLKRYPNSKFMLIDSDIRGFKFINQQYGEAKANKLLFYFSKLLYENTKTHDGLVSRGYADHFCIFIKVSSVHKAMHFFKQDLETITEATKHYELPFMPKFGIAFYAPKMQDEIPSVQILISRASFAKSTIKDNALQQFAIYDEKLLRKSKEENFIETHMESALLKNEFFVMYQPKIDLANERIVGAEALVRWQSPELGYMPPNSFVPLFERNNFIIKLDFYVYEQVFKFLRKCLDNNEPVVPISVNVSRNHDKPEKFVHDFTSLLKRYEIPPKLVEVELLERSTLDKNLLRDITVMLQKEGFRVAMDDFGSGESSLNMLSTIPVNILKFDRSFLFANDSERGTLDETSESFIETLVDLGKNLKKETIFEGVETEEQRDFLRKIKCDQVQGFFYSKPLKEEEFMDFLKKHK